MGLSISSILHNEKTGGILLIIITALSLLLANSAIGENYISFWNTPLGPYGIGVWINDGLMAIFFLLVGLELRREIQHGELSNLRKASLPIFAALGGMFVPAGIYLALNNGTIYQNGAGIPMATDIAFAVGVLSLLGNRVPLSLKVFLTALAVIDDLGAIIVIALFYSTGLDLTYLGIALGTYGLLLLLNRFKVNVLAIYLIGGAIIWYALHHSGIHATIAGVLLAFALPSTVLEGKKSMAAQVESALHMPVPYLILPLFAMANTAILLNSDWTAGFTTTGSIGIILGLVIGKPVGIYLFSLLALATGYSTLAEDIRIKHVFAVGALAGIGFTMSIFVTNLAFADNYLLIDQAKIAILAASFLSALIGYFGLHFLLKTTH